MRTFFIVLAIAHSARVSNFLIKLKTKKHTTERRNFLTPSLSELLQFPNFIVSVSIKFDPHFTYLFIDFILVSFSSAVDWNQSEGSSQWRLRRRSVLLALMSSAWRWRIPRFAMDTVCELLRLAFFEQSHMNSYTNRIYHARITVYSTFLR